MKYLEACNSLAGYRQTEREKEKSCKQNAREVST